MQFVHWLQVELEGGIQTSFRSEHFPVSFSFRVTLPQKTVARWDADRLILEIIS